MNAKEANRAAQKRATEIKAQQEAAELKRQQEVSEKWRKQRADFEKNEREGIAARIAEAVEKGQHSTSVWMVSNDEKERSGEDYFWQTTPYKSEWKRVLKHFEDEGYTLKVYVKERENVDLSDLNPRDNWITYETKLRISW